MPKIPDRLKQEARYQLYNESCFETFKRIPDKSIDMVMTDPPYGTTGCKWDSIIPLEPMWKELKRITKDSGAILFTANQPFTSKLVSSNFALFRYGWIWRKPQGANFLNFKYQPSKVHEEVLVFGQLATSYTKQGKSLNYFPIMEEGKAYTVKQGRAGDATARDKKTRNNSLTTENKGERYPQSVLEFPLDKHKMHPTQKPVALLEYLIKTYTNENDLVLDFAMGSGTTGVACGNLNRRFIGCDNDTTHGYFEIAKKRISEAYNKGGS